MLISLAPHPEYSKFLPLLLLPTPALFTSIVFVAQIYRSSHYPDMWKCEKALNKLHPHGDRVRFTALPYCRIQLSAERKANVYWGNGKHSQIMVLSRGFWHWSLYASQCFVEIIICYALHMLSCIIIVWHLLSCSTNVLSCSIIAQLAKYKLVYQYYYIYEIYGLSFIFKQFTFAASTSWHKWLEKSTVAEAGQ